MSDAKTALVTGGSRGIGAATAIQLAEQGYNVVVNYLNDEAAAARTAERIGAVTDAIAVRTDIADPDQVWAMVDRATTTFGGVHVLVNNAGFSQHANVDDLSRSDWQRMIDVGLTGAFHCVQAVLSSMRESRWGRIVNVSSLRAMTGSDHGVHYTAAKAGIIGLTKALALELAPEITVNAVSPGYTATDMNRAALADPEKRATIEAKIPLKRIAEPQEVAAVIAFLASEQASYITGETINVNGGIYIR
ncbi:MAG: SDR family NAD(P)-dependent oxidoreductase [Candidatus Bipolaricaulia bacterium]